MSRTNRREAGLLSLALICAAAAGCGGEAPAEPPAAADASSDARLAAASQRDATAGGGTDADAPGNPASEPVPPQAPPAESAEAEPAAGPGLRVEPDVLDFGTIPGNETVIGTVKLVNDASEPLRILDCKADCRCTGLNCPRQHALQPGESTDVDVRLDAWGKTAPMEREVSFLLEGRPPVKLPVRASVVMYIVAEPAVLDPKQHTEVVVRSGDGEPFRILKMNPPLITRFDLQPRAEHRVAVDWDRWEELGPSGALDFETDHPQSVHVVVPIVKSAVAAARARKSQIISTEGEASQVTADLVAAARFGRAAEIRAALEKGLPSGVRDGLLNVAALYGQVEVMKMLLEAGAGLAHRDERGRTPLMSAVQSRKLEAVRLLLDAGAEVDARDTIGGTALTRAAGPLGNARMVEALLEAGADPAVTDDTGQTPLIWAVRFGDPQRVRLLLEAGADAAARDGRGRTAMDYAQARNDDSAKEIVSLLEGSGAAG